MWFYCLKKLFCTVQLFSLKFLKFHPCFVINFHFKEDSYQIPHFWHPTSPFQDPLQKWLKRFSKNFASFFVPSFFLLSQISISFESFKNSTIGCYWCCYRFPRFASFKKLWESENAVLRNQSLGPKKNLVWIKLKFDGFKFFFSTLQTKRLRNFLATQKAARDWW